MSVLLLLPLKLLGCYNTHICFKQSGSLSPTPNTGLNFGSLQSRFPSKLKGPDGSHVATAAFPDDVARRDFHFEF